MPFLEGLRAIRGNAQFWYATAGLTLMTFSIGGLGFWMPKYLEAERGFSPTDAGFTLGATTVLGGFIGTMVGGLLGDRLDRRLPGGGVALSAVGLLAAAPLMVVAATVQSGWKVDVLGLSIRHLPRARLAQLFIFLNNGPLNAAMVNAVGAPLPGLRLRHRHGDAAPLGRRPRPTVIGRICDASSLGTAIKLNAIPVALGGLVLLVGLKHWRRPAGAPAAASNPA